MVSTVRLYEVPFQKNLVTPVAKTSTDSEGLGSACSSSRAIGHRGRIGATVRHYLVRVVLL